MSRPGPSEDKLLDSVHRRRQRASDAERSDPSLPRQLARIGVLGWVVVTPTLLGFFGGRWLDHAFGRGMHFSLGLLLLGLVLGCWSGWKWIVEG